MDQCHDENTSLKVKAGARAKKNISRLGGNKLIFDHPRDLRELRGDQAWKTERGKQSGCSRFSGESRTLMGV